MKQVLFVCLAALALVACGSNDSSGSTGASGAVAARGLADMAGKRLGKNLEGDPVTLGQGALAGKTVILNYFHST